MSQDQVRTFAHTIAAINHGALDDELSDDLSKLLATLQREASTQGKARGKISLTLAVKVEQNGVVTIVPETKTLHERFRALRLHGEWFFPGGELLSYLSGCICLAEPVQ